MRGYTKIGEKAAIRKPFKIRILMKEVRYMSGFSKKIEPGHIIVLCSLSCAIGIAIPAIILFFYRL